MNNKMRISILVPCYNEEKNIEPMANAIKDAMSVYEGKYDYEIIFRDNASTDRSLEILKRISRSDHRIKVIVNARNYGLDFKKNTYFGRVFGDVVISIPCDFQEPPELIPEFISHWEKGYEVVCGQKTSSKEGGLKYGLRQLYYQIIDSMSDYPIYRNMSGITLISGRLFQLWQKDGNTDEPFRYFVADIGCDVKLIPYEQQKRRSGKSSYNIWRYLSFAIDSMISTSKAPLRVATVSGFCMAVISFLIGLFYLVAKLIWWERFPMGTAPILIGMFFLCSVQLLFIGVVGEYVGNILRKVTQNNPPMVRELINFENAEADPYLVQSSSHEAQSASNSE